jgi:hypothetical protein
MKLAHRFVLAGLLLTPAAAPGHDIITTSITWDRDISRIVNERCASCHHSGGIAFSLMSYAKGRPWAEAIKEEVLARRMPPWGAVKGFGDFRNDQALSSEQLERIVSWRGKRRIFRPRLNSNRQPRPPYTRLLFRSKATRHSIAPWCSMV